MDRIEKTIGEQASADCSSPQQESPARRPKVLLLVHRVPYPPNRGDRIRSYHLLKFLARFADVHLATLADEPTPAADRTRLEELCRQVVIEPLGAGRWLRGAAALASGKSATEGMFDSPALRQTVRKWAREVRFDAVVIFCSSMASYGFLPELSEARMLVDLVDVDSQKWLDYAATAGFPRRQLFSLEGRRVRKLERTIVRRANAVMMTSEQEADILRSFAPTQIAVGVSNGVDLKYYAPGQGLPASAPATCVFVGVLDYRANVEGLRWFCSEVWPRVREQVPEAQFNIVGRRPVAAVERLGAVAGVHVVGEVPDVRPYLAGAEMCIAPLHVARGIQNKVLEAMAMGRAVLASPQALEGIGLQIGVEACQAASAEEWTETILLLHHDPEARRQLGAAARAFAQRCHTWDECLAPVASLLGWSTDDSCLDVPSEADASSAVAPLTIDRQVF
ncbi:MAG: TIGR03087 family PEP-CTERM/XrtA system glycosyltransferase [Planctomycetes bacterium]|nr:TIGR03087 family PEP-CTERM/XrtA system glycosyltransferase [Planctomycetota bacterium]